MMCAYEFLDYLLFVREEPFSPKAITDMLLFNQLVLYGEDAHLMEEGETAIQEVREKYRQQIIPISTWYSRHKEEEKKNNALKLAAEIYVGILSFPQLFNEGNH